MAKRATTPAHEYAAIFPLHDGQPLWDLAERIKKFGQREPIVLLDGKILDGRRREMACFHAGVEPSYRNFGSRKSDGGDPLEFVYDLNYHRRHMAEGDRAMSAARYAKARVGNPNLSKNDVFSQSSQVETIGLTNAQAAEKFEVSEAAVDRAKVVITNGTPTLQAAVAEEVVTLSDAAKVAKAPPEVQEKAIESVRNGTAKSAAAAVREPGDDTESEEADRREARKNVRSNGKPAFDDRGITDAIGKLARLFNERANALHMQRAPAWDNVREKMDLLIAAWESWQGVRV